MMITLHFHLLPQYKYELFHIYFTLISLHGKIYELNKLTSFSMCGFIAQLVDGIAPVSRRSWVSNPLEALIFNRLLLSNCLNWKIYCDDHTTLSENLLIVSKFRARKWHRTVYETDNSVACLVDNWSLNIDHGFINAVVFLDLDLFIFRNFTIIVFRVPQN